MARVGRRRWHVDGNLGAEHGTTREVEAIAAPEAAGVVPVERLVTVEQTHPLIRQRHQFGAVDVLEGDPAAGAALEPVTDEPERGREVPPAEFAYDAERGVLHFAGCLRIELADEGALPVTVDPGGGSVGEPVQLSAASASPVQTSTIERPSSACHSSGGRSSIAKTIATWLTGLLVANRIARSASLRPVNNQMSPLRLTRAASSRVIRGRLHAAYCTTHALVEVAGSGRVDRRRHGRRSGRATAARPPVDRLQPRGPPIPPTRPTRRPVTSLALTRHTHALHEYPTLDRTRRCTVAFGTLGTAHGALETCS